MPIDSHTAKIVLVAQIGLGCLKKKKNRGHKFCWKVRRSLERRMNIIKVHIIKSLKN